MSEMTDLLERIVDRLDTLIDEVRDVENAVRDINKELNWVGPGAFAKQVVDGLSDIEKAVDRLKR